MNMRERLELAGMVSGMVVVVPAVVAAMEMSKPYTAGAGFFQIYWPKAAAHGLAFTAILIHRFGVLRWKAARQRGISRPD